MRAPYVIGVGDTKEKHSLLGTLIITQAVDYLPERGLNLASPHYDLCLCFAGSYTQRSLSAEQGSMRRSLYQLSQSILLRNKRSQRQGSIGI